MIKNLKRLYSLFLLGLVLLCTTSIQAQQTHLLLDPVGAGGFELGNTFESNGWNIINDDQTNKWVLGNIPTWFVGNGAYISNDEVTNAYTIDSASTVHLYRDITFPAGVESVTISLDVNQAGESSYDNLLIYLIDDSITPSLLPSGDLSTVAVNPTWTGFTNESTGYFLTRVAGTSTPNQTNIVIELNQNQINYVSNSTKRFVLTWRNDTSVGSQPPASIDNVKIQAFVPSCPMVHNLVSQVSSDSFTVSWQSSSQSIGSSYEVRVSGLPGSGADGLISSDVIANTENSFSLNNLDANTTYRVYVMQNCSISLGSSNWNYIEVTTLCSIYEDIDENFDNVQAGGTSNLTIPDCWSFIDSGVGSGYVSTTAAYSLPNGYYINNASDTSGTYILVSPVTNNLGNGQYRVKFKAKKQYGTENTVIDFVTLSNPENTQGMEIVEEISLTGNFQEFIVYLPEGTNDYFGFKHRTTSTTSPVFIDDVIYEPIPSCIEVTNLEATINFATSSVILNWENPPLENLSNQFEVQFGLENFELGSGTIQSTTGLTKVVSELTIGETYDFYVRRFCNTNDQSKWVGPLNISLDYCVSHPTSNDNLGISGLTFGNENFVIEDVTYVDLTEEIIEINAEEEIVSSITFETGYSYDTHIWIDFNKDGVFDNVTEKVYTGESNSINPTTLNTSFSIDKVYESGTYRVRIGTADSGQSTPNPCYSGSYGVTIDLSVNITFPCLAPTNLNATDITNNSATLNWNAVSSNYSIEYGPEGFQQGHGILFENVNNPYVLEGLTDGGKYSFYVKQICLDGESNWSVIKNFQTTCNTPVPEGASIQTLVEDDVVSQIVVSGQALKYYIDPELTQQISATAPLNEGFYYITQTIGCESDFPLTVYVQLIERIDVPVVPSVQEFCGITTISDLTVNGLPNATVNWYTSLNSNEAIVSSTALTTGVYYVNQTDGITTSHRVPVNIIVNEIPNDLVSMTVLVCGYANYGSLEVGQQQGVTMKWYTSLTSMTPISNNQAVVSGVYFVTQSLGICETNRVQITVNAFEALQSPIAAIQTFCGSAVVSQLVAQGVNGAQLKWYDSLSSSVELNSNTQLTTGTYYVEQQINGCVSPRKAVAVRVVSQNTPIVDGFIFCGSASVSDLIIPAPSGVTYKWFNSPNSEVELTQATNLTTGIYYVSRVQYGCESARTPVQVTIQSLPATPTGNVVQSLQEGSTVSDLLLDQENVTWYISYNDSQNGINPLFSHMPLVKGTTYYAVTIGQNGCPSLPLAVTVDVYLSNQNFDMNQLKYYPNPVVDWLNITYSEQITTVQVFDLLGKQVKTIEINNSEVKVDLSDLSVGTYMLQLNTDSKQQFIKVIKK